MTVQAVMQQERIGIIGLGLLGAALAERLLDANLEVVGWDIDAERRDHLTRLGGHAAESALQVASCGRIVLSLPNSDVVRAVVDEIQPALDPNTLIVDTTTGEPVATAKLGAALAVQAIGYVDATVAGSSEQARRGDVIVMAGGRREQFDACADIFTAFARRAYHVGECGSGARMKLIVNLVLGLNRAVLAEGLSLAAAAGVDLATCLEILRDSAAYSTVMDTKGMKMVDGDFSAQARLAQHLKDVRLILDLGQQHEAELPLSRVHQQLLESAVKFGFGEADNSAIIRAFNTK